MTDPLDLDMVIACADLVGRAGAASFEIGYVGDDNDPRWYAHAQYQGARVTAENHADPETAAYALARRLLRGATCKCGKPVALRASHPNACLWRLAGQAWEPGCHVPPVAVLSPAGDIAAMQAAMTERMREARNGG